MARASRLLRKNYAFASIGMGTARQPKILVSNVIAQAMVHPQRAAFVAVPESRKLTRTRSSWATPDLCSVRKHVALASSRGARVPNAISNDTNIFLIQKKIFGVTAV